MPVTLKEFKSTPVNLYVDQGDTYFKELTLRDSLGVPIDLSGYDIVFDVKRYQGLPNISCLTTAIAQVPISGTITLGIDNNQTASLQSPVYVYQVIAVNATEKVKLLHGQIIMENF
jgi:hypothetical protein